MYDEDGNLTRSPENPTAAQLGEFLFKDMPLEGSRRCGCCGNCPCDRNRITGLDIVVRDESGVVLTYSFFHHEGRYALQSLTYANANYKTPQVVSSEEKDNEHGVHEALQRQEDSPVPAHPGVEPSKEFGGRLLVPR